MYSDKPKQMYQRMDTCIDELKIWQGGVGINLSYIGL